MTTLLASLADAAVVLVVGLAIVICARRSSASVRHAILASAIVCALAMPALEMLLPQVAVIPWSEGKTWSSGLILSSDALTLPFAAAASPQPPPGISWIQWLLAVWVAGSVVMGVGLMVGFLRLRRLKTRCTPVSGRWRELTDQLRAQCGVRRHVRLLQSGHPSVLITCGFFQPVIILPSAATSWRDERCRAVLRHELAHIRRHDAAVQIAGEVLRVVQWINPLVWLACRRLRQESEYACDDDVLRGGVEATDYAAHLLDVARQLCGRDTAWLSAPAIAHPSTLERRIVAMLQRHRNRRPLGRTGWALAAVTAFGISLPLAAASLTPVSPATGTSSSAPDVTLAAPRAESRTPDAPSAPIPATPRASTARPQQATGSIGGTIVDQTGGTLPGVQVTLSNAAGIDVTMQTDARGQFAARDLPAGEYEMVARGLPGFATVTNLVKLAAGQNIQGALTMPLGTLQETIVVACDGAAPPIQKRFLNNAIFPMSAGQAVPVSDTQAIRVGGNVRAPKKITDVRPSCPSAPAAETHVRVTGRIGHDGSVFDIQQVHAHDAAAPQEFVDATIDAVRQWKFTPTLLNGQRMEVAITVDVKFAPARSALVTPLSTRLRRTSADAGACPGGALCGLRCDGLFVAQ